MSKTTEKQTIEGTYGGIKVQVRTQVQVEPYHHFRAEVTLTQDGNTVHLPLHQWHKMVPYVERQIGLVADQELSRSELMACFNAWIEAWACVGKRLLLERHQRETSYLLEKHRRETTTKGSK